MSKTNSSGSPPSDIEDTPYRVSDMHASDQNNSSGFDPIRFCSLCGSADLKKQVPAGDTQLRLICQSCGKINYQDSKIVTGCIANYGNKILLCRRAIEPRYGYWSLPSGYLEPGESSLRSAVREAREETNASIDKLRLYCMFEMPQINHVYLIFRAGLRVPVAFPGDESLEIGFFSKETLPWDLISFPSEYEALRRYFANPEDERDNFHAAEFFWNDDQIKIQRF